MMNPTRDDGKKPDTEEKDEIAAKLPYGGSLWPRLDRMAEVSCGMQQLEWALARRAAKNKQEQDNPPEEK